MRSRHTEWFAYKKAFALSMAITEISKHFPKEERYSLTDQIRRSSRSVCANLAEAYGRRAFPKHFRSKLYDCVSENFETQTWLAFARAHDYLDEETLEKLTGRSEEVGRLLSFMIREPEKFR